MHALGITEESCVSQRKRVLKRKGSVRLGQGSEVHTCALCPSATTKVYLRTVNLCR